MNGQPFSLDAITVKSPCSVPWETMKGDDRSRHCDLCKLNVFNLSEMTPEEAEKLILTTEGRVCIQIYRRADGTVVTKDCTPIRARRARRMFAYAVGCALLLTTQALAFAANVTNRRSTARARQNPHADASCGAKDKILAKRDIEKLRATTLYAKSDSVKSAVDWVDNTLYPKPTPGPTPSSYPYAVLGIVQVGVCIDSLER
ncbi:hypothetical protein HYR69_06710 [Candidatus Sumerlaeota bacterium]|nr:hypothetical protein [Candidatus Sumerlaeota bacterium]MBI3736142.1 hypothetical protein [Candidatus Sumerlaeota bacterium]